MVADNAARMNRFRALPLRGRLAILTRHALSIHAAVEAAGLRDPTYRASLSQAIKLGGQACIGKLSDSDVCEIDPLVSAIVSQQAKLSRMVVEAGDDLPALISDVLQESAHIGVRILLAAKALQTDAFGDASVQLDEGFDSVLEYMDEVIAVVSPSQSADQQRRLLNQRLSRLDSQLEQMAILAETTRADHAGFLSVDVRDQLGRTGRDTEWRRASGVPRGDGQTPAAADADTSGTLNVPKKKGLGIGAFFILLAILKIISRMDGCGQGPQKAGKLGPPQVHQERPQQNLDVAIRDLNSLTRLQRIQTTLTEAKEAAAAGEMQAAEFALQRASADLRKVPNADLLDDNLVRLVVHLAWSCADMMRPANAEDSLASYELGVRAARSLAERSDSRDDRSILAALLNNQSIALQELGRSSESLELLTEAEDLQSAALESDPSNEQYRTFLSNHYASRMDVHVSLKQWPQAADAAARGRALWTTQSESLYGAACRLAYLATTIRDCPDAVPDRDRMVDELAGQALDALRAARGTELNLAAEIQQNGVLKILESVTPEDPR